MYRTRPTTGRGSAAWNRFSATKVKAFHCPLRGFYEMILRTPAPASPISVFGTSLHYSFERFFRRHPRTRRFPFEEQKAFLGQWFLFWWTAVVGSGASEAALAPYRRWFAKLNDERRRDGKKPTKPHKPHGFDSWSAEPQPVLWSSDEQPLIFYRWGNRVLRDYHTDFLLRRLDGTRRFVERYFHFNWHGFTITGYLDLVEIGPDGGCITDYKLSFYGLPLLETDVQFTMYQLAWDEYFRCKHTDWPPLARMNLYNYHRRFYQPLPLRSPMDMGLLLAYLTENSQYIKGVLTGERPGSNSTHRFQWRNPNDLSTGNFSPLLPRGEHCTYCTVYRECRQRELGLERRTCRELFLEQHRMRHPAPEGQGVLFPPELPLVQYGARAYDGLPRSAPPQPDLFLPHEE